MLLIFLWTFFICKLIFKTFIILQLSIDSNIENTKPGGGLCEYLVVLPFASRDLPEYLSKNAMLVAQ